MVTSLVRMATPPAGRPLRIAVVAPPWYEVPPRGYGGVEAICGPLVDGLTERGHDVVLIGAGAPRTSARFLRTYLEPQADLLGDPLPELVHIAKANRMIAGRDFDVIHDHTLAGPISAAHREAPTVVTVHGPVDGELGDLYAALGDEVPLVAISDAQRMRRPDLPWIGTVHNSIQVERFPYRRKKGKYALWLARFCEEKGPELAIEACRAAGLPLVLAGKCSESSERDYLDERVRPLLRPDVRLVLNGDRNRTLRLLAGARCLLLPLRWPEPFGMAMIEAMASGTPVVALARGAAPEVVRHGVTGLLCQDPGELPDALRAVGDLDPSACRRHVEQRFSSDVMAARYEKVYRAVLEGRRPGAGRAPAAARQPAAATVAESGVAGLT